MLNLKVLLDRFKRRLDRGDYAGREWALYYLLDDNYDKLIEIDFDFKDRVKKYDISDDLNLNVILMHLFEDSKLFWDVFENLKKEEIKNNKPKEVPLKSRSGLPSLTSKK